MQVEELDISGCYIVKPRVFQDKRGLFVKTYHEEVFRSAGIEAVFREEYYSVSHQGVVRGLHFQTPPHAHTKMVYCPKGAVFDAFVDLRGNSKTYLQHRHVELNEENGLILVLAEGVAHGFCAMRNDTLMVYKTSTVYNVDNDAGILWSSCGIEWPELVKPELLSDRDKSFPSIQDFNTPFRY